MDDPAEHALVLQAFRSALGPRGYVRGYADWDGNAAVVARRNLAALDGLTVESIRETVIDFVNNGDLEIIQCRETRPQWYQYDFYYRAILRPPDYPGGIFVEIRLVDDDPSDPVVQFVNAHRQGV